MRDRGAGPASGIPASGMPASGRPAEPYQPGNDAAVRHGAFSPRLVAAEAEQVVAELGRPAWISAVDGAALVAWSYAEARCRLLRRWLDDRPPVQEDGTPWRAERELIRWENRAAAARAALGLDPLSRARLGKDSAIAQAATSASLDRLRQEGREILAARAVDGSAGRSAPLVAISGGADHDDDGSVA